MPKRTLLSKILAGALSLYALAIWLIVLHSMPMVAYVVGGVAVMCSVLLVAGILLCKYR